MVLRCIVTSVMSAVMLAGGQVPAHALVGHVHMVVRLENPAFNDVNQLLLVTHVANLGPDTATTVRTMQSGLYCATPTTLLAECTNSQPVVEQMADIPAGGRNVFVTILPVPPRAVTIRTTVQVVRIDQYDDFSVPGTCNYGQRPQDDCDTVVITLAG